MVPEMTCYCDKNNNLRVTFSKMNKKLPEKHVLSIFHAVAEQYIGNKIQTAAERQILYVYIKSLRVTF